ncbi:MAG TPA: hypothetical protein VLI69_00470 [Gammaproteobacteria bacterium]|nr:hypothetical protein [Gammaproteobacteria bacterium]
MSDPRDTSSAYNRVVTQDEVNEGTRQLQHERERKSDLDAALLDFERSNAPIDKLRVEILKHLTDLEKDGGYDAGKDKWKEPKQHHKHAALCRALDCLEGKKTGKDGFERLEKDLGIAPDSSVKKEFALYAQSKGKSQTKLLLERALEFKDKITIPMKEIKTGQAPLKDNQRTHYKHY